MALDLVDDPEAIEAYKKAHRKVWPQVINSIKAAGVIDMEIFLRGNRLLMLMEVDESFSFENKARLDAQDPKVQQWERLMEQYQQILPEAAKGEKWSLMESIFKLS